MVDPAVADLALVSRLLREARPGDAVGRELAAVGSDASQFVGWLNVATGEHDAAGPLYDESLRLGLQAGDRELAATALSMRGHLAWVTDDPGEMAALSRAARELAGSPATRATAAQQEGRALALVGDRRGALRAVGEAEEALTSGGAEDPDLLYFSGPGLLLAQRGLILAYLAETPAQHAEAADVIARGVSVLPPEVRDAGWFAWYRVQLARERARGGEGSEGGGGARGAGGGPPPPPPRPRAPGPGRALPRRRPRTA
jgi:ATP/maltotriose-dependent transcriptional regulator MalT